MHTFPFDPLRHRLLTLLGVVAILLAATLAAAPELETWELGAGGTATGVVAPETPSPSLAPLTEQPQAGPLAPPAPGWLHDPLRPPLPGLR